MTSTNQWSFGRKAWAVAALVAVVTGAVAAAVAPGYDDWWPEPSPAADPFYYVDYEKSAAYHERVASRAAWPVAVGLAVGVPAGLVCWVVCRRWSSARPTPNSTLRTSLPS